MKAAILCIFFTGVLQAVAQTSSQDLAFPMAINIRNSSTNTVVFPFYAEGSQAGPGKWKARQSIVKGIFQLSYNLSGQSGGFFRQMEKSELVAINGY